MYLGKTKILKSSGGKKQATYDAQKIGIISDSLTATQTWKDSGVMPSSVREWGARQFSFSVTQNLRGLPLGPLS